MVERFGATLITDPWMILRAPWRGNGTHANGPLWGYRKDCLFRGTPGRSFCHNGRKKLKKLKLAHCVRRRIIRSIAAKSWKDFTLQWKKLRKAEKSREKLKKKLEKCWKIRTETEKPLEFFFGYADRFGGASLRKKNLKKAETDEDAFWKRFGADSSVSLKKIRWKNVKKRVPSNF